jgi:hypothetical protein
MRALLRFKIPMIALALGLGACASDEEVPGNELAAQGKTPEVVHIPPEYIDDTSPPDGTFQGDEFHADACHVKLVYCRDPRWSPHHPSYCANGCSSNERHAAAVRLCRRVCGNIDCGTFYYLGGC